MKTFKIQWFIRTGVSLGLWLAPGSVWACAVCFGASDEPMARGMNMGILALLAVTGMVLGGAATFCVYLANQAKKAPPEGPRVEPFAQGNREGT